MNHYVQLICELHRYPNLEHRTDAVTGHGLDEGDVAAIVAAYGALAKRGINGGTVCITHTEHMSVRMLHSNSTVFDK